MSPGPHMAAPPGENQARRYLDWVGESEARRVPVAWQTFRGAGLPAQLAPDELVALTELLVSWYPFVIASGRPSAPPCLTALSMARSLN